MLADVNHVQPVHDHHGLDQITAEIAVPVNLVSHFPSSNRPTATLKLTLRRTCWLGRSC